MFQLYRNHTMLTSESSDTSSCGLSSMMESSKNILYSASSLPHTLDDLLAGMKVPEKEARQPPPSHSKCSTRNESVLVNLDASDGETSASDSGSESPVCVELPPQPVIREHTVSTINAQVSWTGPQNGELISFYELQLQEAKLDGQGKNIHWFCSQTEEHLENLTPGTVYVIRVRALNVAGAGKWSPPYRFGTIHPVPGMPLDPSPVTVTVRRRRKPQRKTIFIPAP
ncbi:fibronectin type III domain-containing protein 8 [Python bivittatus]|uniref:Fibronectin type III domain-containing protein 8 n=1 Tax=Python bivittatus TaxID=176946 RepID=A0A9F5J511_PYTBI|nr:fibronectin type III domain-containing protein 8 [Python bivittatus]